MSDILVRIWRNTYDAAHQWLKALGTPVATLCKRGREKLRKPRIRCKNVADLLTSLRSIAVNFTILVLLLLFIPIVYHDCTQNVLLVEPFSVPPELQALGYNPPVMANQFVDQVQAIADEVKIASKAQPLFTPPTEPIPDIEVPDTGFSLKSIINLLRGHYRATTERISADATLNTNALQLTLRIDDQTGRNTALITGRVDQMDTLMRAAAEEALRHIDPYLLVAYYLTEDRPSEAIVAVHSCLNKGTIDDKAAAYSAWGIAYMLQTNYEAGATKLQEALRIKPGFINALDNLATLALFQGQLSNAVRWSEVAIKTDPRDATAYRNLGMFSLLQSNLNKSLAMTLKASQLDPPDPQTYANLAAAFLSLGRYSEGIVASERAIELGPDLVDAYNNLGAIYFAQSNFPSALAAYEEAMTAVERNERKRGRNSARSLFHFISLQGGPPRSTKPTGMAELYYNTALVLSAQAKYNDALNLLKKAVARDPNYAPAYYHIAAIYFDRGAFPQALEPTQEAIRLDPTLQDAYSLIALTLEHLGKWSEACTYLKQATEQEPTVSEWWFDWGLALEHLGDRTAAMAKYKRASELNPTSPDSLVNWGELLRQAKDFDGAIDKYKRAIALNPNLRAAFFDLGLCYIEQQDYDKAIAVLKRTTEIDPKFTMAYVHWAEASEEVGDYKAAAAKWQEALQISPHLFEHSDDEITELLQKNQPIP
ncbi:MAG: tetratricopeptide repeat protein [Verrucomicrobiia bacterium]